MCEKCSKCQSDTLWVVIIHTVKGDGEYVTEFTKRGCAADVLAFYEGIINKDKEYITIHKADRLCMSDRISHDLFKYDCE